MLNFPGLTVYFDGLCPLCSREIDHYRRQVGSESINFIDITSEGFDAAREGLDPIRVHKVMHVKTAEGILKTKVEAFVAIWNYLPRYHLLAQLAGMRIPRFFMDQGYRGFAFIRPYLPRKDRSCEASPYCDMRKS